MDIAKIRKKLREKQTESQQSAVNSQPAEEQEVQPLKPDENISESSKTAAETIQEPGIKDKEETKGEKGKTRPEGYKDKNEGDRTEEIVEILTFSLMKEEFAFSISQLEEILRHQRITMVPKTPCYVLGITSLRGKVIPVIDLKLKLSLTDKPSNSNPKGKILIIKGPKGPIGAVVDKVTGVLRIAKTEIIPPPSHLTETELKFVEGIAVVDKRFISIIKMEEATAIHF